MDSNVDKIHIDPDYARNNTALQNIIKKEEEENQITSEKVYSIIAEEFDKELTSRQNQLEEIEEKITKAQKLLHILRYVLITSYYNKNLEHNVKESETDSNTMGAQNRIHPAIKKLLGKNANLNVFSNLGKRKAVQKICDKSEASTSQGSAPKKMKQESKLTKSKVHGIDNNQNCLKNRKRMQHRIIIGNVSKYMPSIDNDNTTHKWMVYVRGETDKPDISNIVEKVKFYLHPSYKPHDIVEICERPFHLSRRGWGEFPMRVQIVFKCKLNKPVEIVHNLKLDKTCSGRQVLGNETLVDVFLHEELLQFPYLEPSTSQHTVEPLTINHDTLHEEIFIKEEPEDEVDLFLSDNDFLEDSYTPLDIKVENENPSHSDLFKKPLDPKSDKKNSFNLSFEGNDHKRIVFKMPLNPDLEQNSTYLNSDQKPLIANMDRNRSYTSHDESSYQPLSIKLEPGLDHDYCQDDVENAPNIEEPLNSNDSLTGYSFNDEHSYCRPLNSIETNRQNIEPKENNICDNQNDDGNKLRFGLDDSYFPNGGCELKDSSPRKTHSLILNKPIKVLLQTNNQTVLTNGHLVNLSPKNTPPRYSLTITPLVTPPKSTKQSYRIPQNKFRNVGEVLPYLMARFPLWSEKALDPNYKRAFPYVAVSQEQYESWNIGKRINAEWNRAKVLKKILSTESLPDVGKWTVKTYFMYSRSHLYSPPVGFSIFQKHSTDVTLLNSCFANTFTQSSRKRNLPTRNEEAVDIESEQDHSNTNIKSRIIDISDPHLKPQCSYIKEIALDSGIMLKPEEILENVMFNGAERMILEAVKCFADGLIRRAHHYAVCSGSYRPNISEVSKTDIKLALSERSEFKSLEEFRKKRQTIYYFS